MTVSDDARSVIERITAGLPPSFLALVCLNVVFIGVLLWVLYGIALARITSMDHILSACVEGLKASSPGK